MSAILTDEKLDKANLIPVPEFTVEQAKYFGYDDVTMLQKALQDAADRKEAVEKIVPELAAALTTFSEAMNKQAQAIQAANSEAQFDELSRDKFVKHFQSLPENDPLRDDIKKHLLGEFPAAHVELVLEGSELRKTLLRPITDKHKDAEQIHIYRKCWDYIQFASAMKNGIVNDAGDTVEVRKATHMNVVKMFDNLDFPGIDDVQATIEKAMTTGNSEGGEWIPTLLSADYIDEILLDLRVVPLFPRYNMPSPDFKIPSVSGGIRGYIIDENIDDTAVGDATPFFANLVQASQAGSSKIEFVARKLGALTFISDEITEDSLIPTLDIVTQKTKRGMAESMEDWAINGQYGLSANALHGFYDNAGSNGNRLWADDAVGGPRDSRAMSNGLRVMAALSNITPVDGNPVSDWKAEGLDIFRNARKNMGKYGQVNMGDLYWLIGLATHIELLKLNQVVTVDKYGPQATVHVGEIGMLDGVPLIISPFVYENLDNLGFYTNGTAVTYSGGGWLDTQTSAGNSDRTAAYCVHRQVAAFGDRRLMRVESDRNPISGQRYIVNTWRGDMKKKFGTAEKMIGWVRNLRT